MGVRFESCKSVDEAMFGWCATKLNEDGTFERGFCNGNCSYPNLVADVVEDSECCNQDEVCYTVNILPDNLGKEKIALFNLPLTFERKAPPNVHVYEGDAIEAMFR